MIAAGVSVGGEAVRGEPARPCDEVGGGANGVVGAEEADGGGDAAARHPAQRERRDPRLGPRLAAAAGEMHVAVYQPRNDPSAAEVVLADLDLAPEPRHIGADPDDRLPHHEQVSPAAGSGVVEIGIQ